MLATKARQTLFPSEYNDASNTNPNQYAVKFRGGFCRKLIANAAVINGDAGTGNTFFDMKSAGTGSDPSINNFSLAFWMKLDQPFILDPNGWGNTLPFKTGVAGYDDMKIIFLVSAIDGSCRLEARVRDNNAINQTINFYNELNIESFLLDQSPGGDGWNHFILTKKQPYGDTQSYLYTYMNGIHKERIEISDLTYSGATGGSFFSTSIASTAFAYTQNMLLDEVILIKNYGLTDINGMVSLLTTARRFALADVLTSNVDAFDFATGSGDLLLPTQNYGFTDQSDYTFFTYGSGVAKLSNKGGFSEGNAVITLPLTVVPGFSYTIFFDVISVSGTEATVQLRSNSAVATLATVTTSGAAVRYQLNNYFLADDTTAYIYMRLTDDTSGRFVIFDNIIIERVLIPGELAEGEVAELYNTGGAHHVLNPTDLSTNITTNLFAWYRMGDTDAFAVNADGSEDSDGCQDSSGRDNHLATQNFTNTTHFNRMDTPT